jgi:hypothetical protein
VAILESRCTSVIVASRKLPEGKAVGSMVARRVINYGVKVIQEELSALFIFLVF